MRHRTWIRRAAVVATVALAAAGLAACSSGSSTTSGGKTTVTWWSWNPDNKSDTQWIDAFEKEHPDIAVKHRFIQYSNYVNALRLALTSNSGPDVFGLQVGSLTDRFAPLAADLKPYAQKEIGADWQKKLTATDQLAVDGKQVGLPWMITGGGLLWYNKTTLDKFSVTPPTTLAEWKTACQKLEANGVTCFVQGAKDDWVNLDVFQTIANQIEPGGFYKAIVGKEDFDSSTYVKAFTAWKTLFDDGIVQKGALATTEYPDANDAFSKGQAAMIALGTWQDGNMSSATLKTLSATYGDQITSQVFTAIPFPDVVGGAKETGRLFGGPDVGWAVSNKSKVKDAAFTFVQWLTSSKTAQTMMGKSLQTPALKSVPVDDSDLAAPDVQKPVLDEQATQIADLIGQRELPNADVKTALSQALSSVASGQTSPKDAAASVQKAIDAAYSK